MASILDLTDTALDNSLPTQIILSRPPIGKHKPDNTRLVVGRASRPGPESKVLLKAAGARMLHPKEQPPEMTVPKSTSSSAQTLP